MSVFHRGLNHRSSLQILSITTSIILLSSDVDAVAVSTYMTPQIHQLTCIISLNYMLKCKILNSMRGARKRNKMWSNPSDQSEDPRQATLCVVACQQGFEPSVASDATQEEALHTPCSPNVLNLVNKGYCYMRPEKSVDLQSQFCLGNKNIGTRQ